MPRTIDILHGDGTTGSLIVPSTPFGGSPSYSAEVNDILDETTDAGIRAAIGSINYPYTTDIQSNTAQTRSLTSITNSEGYRNKTNLTSVYVGSSVTSIGTYAFNGCTGLNSINIPNSVTSLGEGAFRLCSSLTSITIPDGVTSISSYAFIYCSGLTSMTIPKGVTSIGNYAYDSCSNLTSITIPKGVTSIGSYAFNYCSSLDTINCLATTAPSLGSYAFNGANTTQIHVPVGATGYSTTYGGLTVVADL